MFDIVAHFLTGEQIRDLSIFANLASAVIIGPWLAFAITPDAGFKCRMALQRMAHRAVLVLFSISLMYNALILINDTGRVPIGSSLILNVMILVCTAASSIRLMNAPDIPKEASWSRPMTLRADVRPKR